jgi:acyl dehydratase
MSGRISGRDRSFYLEDVSVGQRFSTGSLALEEAQIRAFAAQFDPQPFHLDAEIAKAVWWARRERLAHDRDHNAVARDQWHSSRVGHDRNGM